MRRSATVVVAALSGMVATAACSGPASAPAATEYQLRIGDAVQLSAGGPRIGFDGVSSDSRCPEGERCIRAGDATVRLWLQQGAAAPRQMHELRLGPGLPPARVPAGALDLHLLRLDPYPRAGRSIGIRDYVVTLGTLRRTNTDADR